MSDKESKTKTKAKEKKIKISEQEYQSVQDELKEQKDKYVRLMAEFDNARKRSEREKTDFIKYANEGIISEFLGILDDLERTVKAAADKHQDQQAFEKGVEMVMAHIYEMLKNHQVKPIETVGKPFDPHAHEILMQEESSEHDDGSVIEEFQKGYTLGEKVIRTAKVKVAVGASSSASDKEE